MEFWYIKNYEITYKVYFQNDSPQPHLGMGSACFLAGTLFLVNTKAFPKILQQKGWPQLHLGSTILPFTVIHFTCKLALLPSNREPLRSSYILVSTCYPDTRIRNKLASGISDDERMFKKKRIDRH